MLIFIHKNNCYNVFFPLYYCETYLIPLKVGDIILKIYMLKCWLSLFFIYLADITEILLYVRQLGKPSKGNRDM